MGDEEGKNRRAECKVDQIASEPVRHLLDRGARVLGVLDRFNDLAKGGLPAKAIGADLQSAGLVDGAGVNHTAGGLFAGHRFPGDRSLFHERMPADDLAIDGYAASGADQNYFAGMNGLRVNFNDLALPQDAGGTGKEIQHVLNSAPATAHGETFKYLRGQHKRGNH
jgi:hypothetical protein